MNKKIILVSISLILLLPFDSSALDTITEAKLKIIIKGDFIGVSEPSLCLGESNCYPFNNGTCSYDPLFPGWRDLNDLNGCCTIAEHTDGDIYEKDHPFVNHPDNWDHIFIQIPDGSSLNNVERIAVSFDYGGASDFFFVDKSFTAPLKSYGSGERIPVYKWVKIQRECILKSAYCGYSDHRCHLDDPCILQEDINLVRDVNLEKLPWMVRESANDIGQAGAFKYLGIESGNGCDDFYYYYASQYANNLHSSPSPKDSFFPWASSGMLNKWHRSKRLAKVVFIEIPLANMGYHRILADPPVQIVDMNKEPTGIAYHPKPGDYFLLFEVDPDTCPKKRHAMMALDTVNVDPVDNHIKIPVVEKWSEIVQAVYKDLQAWTDESTGPKDMLNARRQDERGNWIFCNEFYFGEVDHEFGGSQYFDKYGDEIPNYGFRAWFPIIINN